MIIEDRRMSREAGPKFREVRRPAKQRPETKEHIREEGGEREGAAQEREVERWAVKDGMDDLGAREQFPSCPEVYTMYPPDTPGQPYVRAPLNPELAELSTVLKLMGLSRGMRAGCHL